MRGYDVSFIFESLLLEDVLDNLAILHNEVEDLWIAVDMNTNNISMLWDDSSDQWVAISDLNSEVDMLWRDSRYQWFSIGMLYLDSYFQWNAIGDLNYKVRLLKDRISAMNHGTINLYHHASSNELEIWGEAPFSADVADIRFIYENGTELIKTSVDVHRDFDNKNLYHFDFDLTDLPEVSYNIRVRFYNYDDVYMNAYDVGMIFDSLLLGEMQEEILILYDEVEDLWIAVDMNTENIVLLWNDSSEQWIVINELDIEVQDLWNATRSSFISIQKLWMDSDNQWNAITYLEEGLEEQEDKLNELYMLFGFSNHATINLEYLDLDSEVNPGTLGVWGEAPQGADVAEIMINFVDGTTYITSSVAVYSEFENANSYHYSYDVTSWPKQVYNVRVKFYDDLDERMWGYDVGMLFNGLYDYGIYVLDVPKPYLFVSDYDSIGYSLKIDESLPNTTIMIASTDSSANVLEPQALRTMDLDNSKLYPLLIDEVIFDNIGTYELYVYIEDSSWESIPFNVEARDFPVSNIYFISPELNWATKTPGMYLTNNDVDVEVDAQEVAWISWDAVDMFEIEIELMEGTENQWCEWNIHRDGQNPLNGDLMVNRDGEIVTCSGTVYEEPKLSAEGLYELFVEASFVGVDGYYTDRRYLGVDNSIPQIIEVLPEGGFYSSEFLVSALVHDSLSGIDYVEFDLVGTDNMSILYDTQLAAYNTGNGLFEATFDSLDLILEDGEYELVARAYDNAGNGIIGSSLFNVDNTKPIIELIKTDYINETVYEGDALYGKVRVLDEFSGVDTVQLLFDGVTCSLNLVSGDEFDGIYETDSTCYAPFYNGVLDLDVTLDALFVAEDNSLVSPNFETLDTKITLFDPVISLVQHDLNSSCIVLTNISISESNMRFIEATNLCNETKSANLTLALNSELVVFNLEIGANESEFIVLFDDFLFDAENSLILNVSFDDLNEELSFIADGDGNETIVIYVGNLGSPVEVYFDNVLISDWTYANGYLTVNVVLGSPHEIDASWYEEEVIVPAKVVKTSSGGGSGFSSLNILEDIEDNETIVSSGNSNEDEKEEDESSSDDETPTQEEKPEGVLVEETKFEGTQEELFTPLLVNNDDAQTPTIGGFVTFNTPTIISSVIGLLLILVIVFFVVRRK
ncbi:MAG: hypothetical protein PF569_01120 [Candidatus Woesearchaeota archaeon]|jgi:hypothetical protein|nr:hypothetical protein [Candidatus Woesearchaeota archaeon]